LLDPIVGLEHRLQALLGAPVERGRLSPRLRATAREWSRAVWAAAEAEGPATLTPTLVERGVEIAQRPVFICGVARSGTTLLRDLLDGHPQLAVIPTESLFHSDLERALFAQPPDRHREYLITEWLERLVFPPPHWLLGRSTRDRSPYVELARNFAAWWQLAMQRREVRTPSWPLAAFALALAQHRGEGNLPRGMLMWADKTLTSERYLHRLWGDFPHAKVLHIVRRPEAVLASLKAMQGPGWSYRSAARMTLGYMRPTYRIAARTQLPDRYRLVRYEDLVADPEREMSAIAGFLGIEPLPVLAEPTVAGLAAVNNSSFGSGRRSISLDPVEMTLLFLAVRRPAAKLGYAPASAWAQDPVIPPAGRAARSSA
jgi:hypothetical protein